MTPTLRLRLVFMLVAVAFLLNCQKDNLLVGQWRRAGEADRSIVSEFFQDGTCSIQARAEGFSGHWTRLPDGRFKIDYTARGTSFALMGTLKDDELYLDQGSGITIWVRIGSEREKDEEALQEGQKYLRSGDFKSAEDRFKTAADRGYPLAQNSLAWVYATANSVEVRDGRKAIEYAERATAAVRRHDFLDTLAAARARNGEFSKACETQREALALLEKSNINENAKWAAVQRYQARLQLYTQGKAYVEAEAPSRE